MNGLLAMQIGLTLIIFGTLLLIAGLAASHVAWMKAERVAMRGALTLWSAGWLFLFCGLLVRIWSMP